MQDIPAPVYPPAVLIQMRTWVEAHPFVSVLVGLLATGLVVMIGRALRAYQERCFRAKVAQALYALLAQADVQERIRGTKLTDQWRVQIDLLQARMEARSRDFEEEVIVELRTSIRQMTSAVRARVQKERAVDPPTRPTMWEHLLAEPTEPTEPTEAPCPPEARSPKARRKKS